MYKYFDKGNCVMLAYILVIYALPSIKEYCDKNFIECPMWLPIVRAVTISSYLFVIGSWFKFMADYLEKSMLKLINLNEQCCSAYRMLMLAMDFSSNIEVLNLRNEYSSKIGRRLDELNDETHIHRIQVIIGYSKNIESIINFISFLMLFVYSIELDKIVTFLKISDKNLESLTVSGFGIMLFFLLLEDVLIRWFDGINSEIENKVKIINEDIEEIIKKLKIISDKTKFLEYGDL